MRLLRVAVHVYAPELAAHHAGPHPLEVRVAEEAAGEVDLAIVDAVVQLDPQLPGKVVVAID